jgi:hypothetical protein
MAIKVGTSASTPTDLTLDQLAAVLKPVAGTVSGTITGDGNERDGKADNLNPKQVAMSLGYDSTTKHSTVEIAEPLIGLSSWSNGGYALGPSDHQLFCTISPNYAVDVVFSQHGAQTGPTLPRSAQALQKIQPELTRPPH